MVIRPASFPCIYRPPAHTEDWRRPLVTQLSCDVPDAQLVVEADNVERGCSDFVCFHLLAGQS